MGGDASCVLWVGVARQQLMAKPYMCKLELRESPRLRFLCGMLTAYTAALKLNHYSAHSQAIPIAEIYRARAQRGVILYQVYQFEGVPKKTRSCQLGCGM